LLLLLLRVRLVLLLARRGLTRCAGEEREQEHATRGALRNRRARCVSLLRARWVCFSLFQGVGLIVEEDAEGASVLFVVLLECG